MKDVRDAAEKEENASLQAPNKSNVEVPSRQQALRAKFELGDFLGCQGRADFVGDPNVGSILTC